MNRVGIRKLDQSNFQIVKMYPAAKWIGFGIAFENRTFKSKIRTKTSKNRTFMFGFQMVMHHRCLRCIIIYDFVRFSNVKCHLKSGNKCPVFKCIRFSGDQFSDGYCSCKTVNPASIVCFVSILKYFCTVRIFRFGKQFCWVQSCLTVLFNPTSLVFK